MTQANNKDVMLITSRSMLQSSPTHRAMKLDHRTVHTRLQICLPCMVKRGDGSVYYYTHGH